MSPESVPEYTDLSRKMRYSLTRCTSCGALVEQDDQETHTAHHLRLSELRSQVDRLLYQH